MEQNVQSIADTEEGWFIAEDGKKLYSKTWKVSSPTVNVEAEQVLTGCLDGRTTKGKTCVRAWV